MAVGHLEEPAFSARRWREWSDRGLWAWRAGLFSLVSLVFWGGSAAPHPVFALCRRTSPLEPGKALEVIGEVGHADLDPGTGDADGADEQAHAVLLPSEHVLDGRADSGALGIGPRDVLGHRPARHPPLLDVALEHAALEKRLVLL